MGKLTELALSVTSHNMRLAMDPVNMLVFVRSSLAQSVIGPFRIAWEPPEIYKYVG